MNPADLHVVAVINNPVRFKSRQALFEKFTVQMQKAGVHLVTVEAAFGARPHAATKDDNPDHVQLVQSEELWLKENLINLGVQRLPRNWKYMAWIDGDVAFLRDDWAAETIHQLQHYAVVQMFQNAVDTGPTGEALQTVNGFGYSFATGMPEFTVQSDFYYGVGDSKGKFWHPGYAWAINREAYDDLGGLIDFAILGAGDHHMALSLIGKGHKAVPKGLHPNYLKKVLVWQDRANRHIRQDLGYVPGTLVHGWHGNKVDRRYWGRWDILKEHQYDPETDIKYDSQGLITFSDQGIRMRNPIRHYHRARNEDSVDLR